MLSQKRKQPNKKTLSAKKQKTNPVSPNLRRAQKSGYQGAIIGRPRPTIELLMQRNHYDQAQAAAYLESFDEHAGDENEQGIRRAKTSGRQAAIKNGKRPTMLELIQRNYNQAQIDAYYEIFDTYKRDENAQPIQKAIKRAYDAVYSASQRPTIEELKKRNYNHEQIIAYHEVFDRLQKDKYQPTIKAKKAAYDTVHLDKPRSATLELMKRGYSQEQIAAYNENYDKYFAAKKSRSNNPILSSNNLELNEVATPPLVPNTSTEEWSVAFFASLLNETEEDHSFRSSSFDIFNDQEKTHSSYHNWQTIDTANSNTEELDLTFASLLGETTEDNTFIPGPFDAITPTEKTDAVNQTAPLLFNYCVKTGSEHNPNFNLEETEDIFGIFDLLETDQSTTSRLA